eukprot:gene9854-7056_t
MRIWSQRRTRRSSRPRGSYAFRHPLAVAKFAAGASAAPPTKILAAIAQQLVDIDEQLDDQLHRIDLLERTLIVGDQRLDEGALNPMVPACARRSPSTRRATASSMLLLRTAALQRPAAMSSSL